MAETRPTVLTVGHSTRAIEELVALLRAHGVERLVDVRTVPRSRRNPQFNREALAESLPAAAIDYTHLPGLGGLRRPLPDSVNGGWRNDAFRGYADYMGTAEFEASLGALMDLAEEAHTAVMCAEAVPWRCHRSLIADALLVRGFPVEDILSEAKCVPRAVTAWARMDGVRITYPAEAGRIDPDVQV